MCMAFIASKSWQRRIHKPLYSSLKQACGLRMSFLAQLNNYE